MPLLSPLSLLSLALAVSCLPSAHASAVLPSPIPRPARPAPHFSWDVVPRAFHGANRSGEFSGAALQALANYSMVTIEKWYTPCASQGPAQAGPSCAVEDRMFAAFRALRALSPAHTNIMYLNSMFDFAFYRLNGVVQEKEAAGERVLLRDVHGQLVLLCNDGNVYCNVTNFDWTAPAAVELWLQAVANATAAGAVDGVFADHLASTIGERTTPDGVPQLCNGSGDQARCYNFTPAFAAAFNAAHAWLGNYTQDLLARLPGRGPLVDGPYASWASTLPACHYARLRAAVEAGQAGSGPFVLEANHDSRSCVPDDDCLANFLAAAEEHTYLTCFADAPVASTGTQLAYPLGPPTGPPVVSGGTVTRSFLGPLGLTNASVNLASGVGSMAWAGQAPPPPPPPPPPPSACGLLPPGTALACCDAAPVHENVSDAGACCALCAATAACAQWCYHGEAGAQHRQCHLHSAQARAHALPGATSGVYQRSPPPAAAAPAPAPAPASAAPLDVLRATIASMLRQTPLNSTFFQYNYGPGYAFAAVYEAAQLRSDLNFTAAVSAYLDLYLQPGGYAYNVTRGVPMPYTGAVGEPTSFAVAYAARARDAQDWAVATQTADVYMMRYPYRLADGTFVRPGGWGAQAGHAFLWGDDQFMALALLCRLARAGAPRGPSYLAVAVANALTNAARAQRPDGLFPHGFNALTNESSCCTWGRANGWVAMSLVELLWALPLGAPERPAVLGVFERLARGLARAQDGADGRWHQVLNESATFLETSASAMFTFALATGASEGWLPRAEFEAPVRAAWAGLLRAVRQDGAVEGVCQGTPVELTVAAYQARTTFYNMSDPGLGAVFRAAMAVQRLLGAAVE